ncbi:hypothetical protein J2S98_002994 [Arthrobacter oryzae]|uniref:hypothetical protein n=1 Tax=Arthrobacter oryzae TaxID=409290 RepID=UPI00277F6D57|nr:hypothetical protein [Arthrobacter oryzae]MDP9987824.1 hypothetical protein [Arthrobacter oryzae]
MAALVGGGVDRAAAVLDSDPLDPSHASGEVFYSELADLDSDLFAIEGMIDRIVTANAQVRDKKVLGSLGMENWREVVLRLVEPWTAVRKHLVDESIPGISMKDFPINRLGDKSTGQVSRSALEKLLIERSGFDPLPDELTQALATPTSEELEPFHNGHHLAAAIAWILANLLASTKMNPNTIEDLARTAITEIELRKLLVVSQLSDWAHQRGTCVWRDCLCDCRA